MAQDVYEANGVYGPKQKVFPGTRVFTKEFSGSEAFTRPKEFTWPTVFTGPQEFTRPKVFTGPQEFTSPKVFNGLKVFTVQRC